MQGGAPLTSVSLSGTATWTAGSYTDTGTITLEAAAGGYSRVDLEMAGGSRVSVRAPLGTRAGSLPSGAVRAAGALAKGSSAADGAVHTQPLSASWTPAAWFFPALALGEADGGGSTLTDLGPLTQEGKAEDHLRAALAPARQTAAQASEIAGLSQADYFLDPATHLPAALEFIEHPSGIVNRGGVRVQVRYGDWRPVAGVEVPFHIERWINGTRQLVVSVTAAQINPALSPTDFQLGGAQ